MNNRKRRNYVPKKPTEKQIDFLLKNTEMKKQDIMNLSRKYCSILISEKVNSWKNKHYSSNCDDFKDGNTKETKPNKNWKLEISKQKYYNL